MFQEPGTKNSADNRAYNGESEIADIITESTLSDIYQLPQRINSEHNRGVDGELFDSTWPPELKADSWNKGIEEAAVNGNSTLDLCDIRLNAVARNMWEL